MKKILILNGPPRCGKDTAADAITTYFSPYVSHLKFSSPLKQIVSMVTGKEHAALEPVKERELVFGGSYRDLQIGAFMALSQVFSPQWLGIILNRSIETDDNDLIVCSDGGRSEDITPLIRAGHKLLILQILRDGTNFNATHDIRTYIADARVPTRTIANEDIDIFRTRCINIAATFFED